MPDDHGIGIGEPLPDAGWSRSVLQVRDALVSPHRRGLPRRTVGVLTRDGADIPQAAHWRGIRFTWPVEEPPAEVERLEGRYLWGGIMFSHFGHFLIESLARLWALELEKFDGILFLQNGGAFAPPAPFGPQIMELLGIDIPIRVVQVPTRVEELVVPGQGSGFRGEIVAGTPEFHAMVRRMCADIAPKGPERIYLSRTRFDGDGGLVDEEVIEETLARHGYVTLHPQDLSIREQIAAYKAATHVIGADSSAFHLLGFAGAHAPKAAILLRRIHNTHEPIVKQLGAMLPEPPQVINALTAEWMPETRPSGNNRSWGELDLREVGERLRDGGFIDDLAGWEQTDTAPRPEGLARIRRLAGGDLVRRPMVQSPAAPALNSAPAIPIVGLCRFSMLGRGDWKAYRGQPDENLEAIYAQKAEELFAPERIEHRLATFEHLTLASLRAQTDQDFRFVVVSSDRMPDIYKERLRKLCEPVEQVSLRFVEPDHIGQVQRRIFEDMDLSMPDCLQFRLDDDDCVSSQFIARARELSTPVWENRMFGLSFATHYYCVTDGPTEGIYRWFSPFLGAGVLVRHRARSIYEFAHYKMQSKFLAITEPGYPNIVTHSGMNDSPRHDAKTLKKRGMVLAPEAELKRSYGRYFNFLDKEGLRLSAFDRFAKV